MHNFLYFPPGKTETTKYILRYLCESGGLAAGPIEQKILEGISFLTSIIKIIPNRSR